MDFFDQIIHILSDAKFYRNKSMRNQYKALIHTVIDMLEKDVMSESETVKQPKTLNFIREKGK